MAPKYVLVCKVNTDGTALQLRFCKAFYMQGETCNISTFTCRSGIGYPYPDRLVIGRGIGISIRGGYSVLIVLSIFKAGVIRYLIIRRVMRIQYLIFYNRKVPIADDTVIGTVIITFIKYRSNWIGDSGFLYTTLALLRSYSLLHYLLLLHILYHCLLLQGKLLQVLQGW